MQVDNTLTLQFLRRYPVEAARVLEKFPPADISALLACVELPVAVPVVEALLPYKAAECIVCMNLEYTRKLFAEMSMPRVLSIWRLLPDEKRVEIFVQLDEHLQRRVEKYIDYASLTAGDLMDPFVITMPQTLSVADTVARLGQLRRQVGCELFVVDDAHRFVGTVSVDRLFSASRRSCLADIMNTKVRAIGANSKLRNLRKLSAWSKVRKLPVVEKDNTLIGILEYERLRDISGARLPADEVNTGLVQFLGLYWYFLAQLSTAFLSFSNHEKARRK